MSYPRNRILRPFRVYQVIAGAYQFSVRSHSIMFRTQEMLFNAHEIICRVHFLYTKLHFLYTNLHFVPTKYHSHPLFISCLRGREGSGDELCMVLGFSNVVVEAVTTLRTRNTFYI